MGREEGHRLNVLAETLEARATGHVPDFAESTSEMSSEYPLAPGLRPDLDEESPRGRKRLRSGELAGGGGGERVLGFNSMKQVSLSFCKWFLNFLLGRRPCLRPPRMSSQACGSLGHRGGG